MLNFGLATLSLNSTPVGKLQEVSLDFSFETAKLYAGNKIYPVDVRVHTGSITGNAAFADINAAVLLAVLGGSVLGTELTLTDVSFPDTFEMTLNGETDGIPISIYFPKVRSTKFSLPFMRDGHTIPNFDFEIESADDGSVATLDFADAT